MHINDTITPCPGFGFIIEPEFDTDIKTRRNKRESRNGNWEQVRHNVSAPMQNISRAMALDVKRLFLVCRGNLHTFYFRDPIDYEAVDEPFGVGDGVETVFQLSKRSTADGVDYDREIYLPVGAVVEVNGGAAASHTIDPEFGTVTFSVAPADGAVLTWSGEFNLKVRFVADRLPLSVDNKSRSGFIMNASIDLLEVPE